MEETVTYHGACTCHAVQFTVIGKPLFTQYCHCNKCRFVASDSKCEADKTGYSFTAAFLTQNFVINEGEQLLEIVEKNNANLYRCSSCHSLIYGISKDEDKQAGIGINANNFNFKELPESFLADKHIFYADRVVDFDDDLPKYIDAPKEQFGSGKLFE